MNTSLSAAWLIIFETCLKDDSGIDLHDTDIDFFICFFLHISYTYFEIEI